jgi:hypothetical protein
VNRGRDIIAKSSFRGAGEAREPGIQKHGLLPLDSGSGPAGHPGMTELGIRTLLGTVIA